MCVVKVNPSLEQSLLEEPGLGDSGRSSSGGKLNSSGSGNGGAKLVPAIDGSGGMVEIVSPHDILQPGLYETWLVRVSFRFHLGAGRYVWSAAVHLLLHVCTRLSCLLPGAWPPRKPSHCRSLHMFHAHMPVSHATCTLCVLCIVHMRVGSLHTHVHAHMCHVTR